MFGKHKYLVLTLSWIATACHGRFIIRFVYFLKKKSIRRLSFVRVTMTMLLTFDGDRMYSCCYGLVKAIRSTNSTAGNARALVKYPSAGNVGFGFSPRGHRNMRC